MSIWADALRNAAQKAGVPIQRRSAATTIDVAGDGFAVKTGDDAYDAAAVVFATGSRTTGYARQGARPPARQALPAAVFCSGSSRRRAEARGPVRAGRARRIERREEEAAPRRVGPCRDATAALGLAPLRLSAFKARELQDPRVRSSRIYCQMDARSVRSRPSAQGEARPRARSGRRH